MEFISLRFTGNDILPSNTRCKDLASLIRATEELLHAASTEDFDGEKVDVQLSLIGVESQSLGLKYAAVHMAVALMTWQNIAQVLNAGEYDRLNLKARESLAEIIHYVKRRGCVAELSDSQHSTALASITPETELPEALQVSGQSSLIGTVVRVGGADPKVGLKLASGKTLSCDTSEAIARQLGHRLYDVVTCKGDVCWDMQTNSITKFRIKEVGSFRQGYASEAFSALAAAMPLTLGQWKHSGFGEDFAGNES